MTEIRPLDALSPRRFETAPILRKLAAASRQLAEFKGVAAAIPNQGILINTLGLCEAKDSSAIENIVTTLDELFQQDVFPEIAGSVAAKEAQRYRQALSAGFDLVATSGLLTLNHILAVQAELRRNSAGFRRLSGTALKNAAGETVYTPPQDAATVLRLMSDLERFINATEDGTNRVTMAKRKTVKQVEALKYDDASRKSIPVAEYQSLLEKESQSPAGVACERRNRDEGFKP